MENDENDNSDNEYINTWVFINKPNEFNMNNESDLNKEHSSVQNVTENDLENNNAETYSDSDGISVISESEPSDIEIIQLTEPDVESDLSTHNEEHDHTNEIVVVDDKSNDHHKLLIITLLTGFTFVVVSYFYIVMNNMDTSVPSSIVDNEDEDQFDNSTTCEETLNAPNRYLLDFVKDSCVDTENPSSLLTLHVENNLYHNPYQNVNSNYQKTKHHNNNRHKNSKQQIMRKDHKRYKKSKWGHNKMYKTKKRYFNIDEKYLMKKEKQLRKLEKYVNHLEEKLRKIHQSIKIEMKLNLRTDKLRKTQHHDNVNVTGDWYEKMYLGRSDIRHKEMLADWIFDRSQMRNKLRDEAHWYFQRVDAREHSRSKKQKQYETA